MLYHHYFNQLQTSIPLLMQESDIPGFSMSVTDKDNIIFSYTYGYTDLSRVIPITSNTQFSIQSISKTYTAFGFMLAVADGKVSLDDTLKKYLPEFTVKYKDGKDYSNLITFKQLLKHRSGLGHEAPVGNNFAYGSFEQHIKSIYKTFLRFKPDAEYSYSNLGIDLVAYVLGKLYDMPFEDYMRNYVFNPLDMKFSTFNQEEFLLQTESAIGCDKVSLVKYPIPMLGAGGMYSTTDDMAHFIMCFLNSGIYKNKKIIDNDVLRLMYTDSPASNDWPYNLGIVAGLINDRVILNHNGGGFGFLATQDIFPNEGIGAAALTNSVNHQNVHQKIIRNMWDDIFDMQSNNKNDCGPLSDDYHKHIGLYEALYNGGSWKLAVVPRNGMLYCNNQKLINHSCSLFFTDNNDCIEFVEGGVRYNYVLARKLTIN